MYQNHLLFVVLLLSSSLLSAQTFKVHGKITNTRMEPLSYVSIQVKGIQKGTISNSEGFYELELEEGTYDIIISIIGYKTQSITIAVIKDYRQQIILEEDTKSLDEITVKGKTKDKAEEIIRNVIRNKEKIIAAPGAYSCNVYIKAVQQDSGAVKKNKNSKKDSINKKEAGDLQNMALTEISLRLDYESERRLKEERLGVKKRGKPGNLFYLSATEGNFNFYNNLLKIPALSPTPFLSPVSYSGLVAYKFKTLAIEKKGTYKIYTLSVRPRKLSNATVEGELIISDSAWTILSDRFTFPAYHLPEYDYFEVAQQYSLIQDKAWLLSQQQFTYYAKSSKRKLSGQTLVTYTDYELNKNFDKHYFGTEISAAAESAYTKDSTFWDTARTEPLNEKEVRFIHYTDSAYRATHTKQYLDSVDRSTNKMTWKKIVLSGQTLFNREKERTWQLPPVLSLYQPLAFGGSRIYTTAFYSKVFTSRKNISLFTNLSYGFRNRDINGSVRFNRLYNPFNRGFYSLSVSRDFQFIYAGDAWINLLKKSNLYLNKDIGIGHGIELANGLFLYSNFDVAFRSSLSNYKTGSAIDKIDSSLGNVLNINRPVAFEPYTAVYGKVRLQYTPKQRYIREPKEKIILGSLWPTFYTTWRKGVPGILNSKVDFDYLEFGMEQQVNVGLLGVSRYTIKTGTFLNQKDLKIVDYQFQRRGDPFLYMNPDEAFQALDSSFPVFKRFYQGHFVHEFNGAILNKIPLLKKLQLREIAGAGFLIAPERNLKYAESFVGMERVFKWPFNPLSKFKLGVYTVGSVANQYSNPVRFKIGITTWDKVKNKWF